MIKKLLLFSLFVNSFLSFSQEIVKEFDLNLERKRDYFQVTNETDKEVILFVNDKEKVSSIRFDEKFNVKDSLSATRPEKKYKEIVGYSQNERNYFLFWASDDRKEIEAQSFDFEKKETNSNSINLELKKEKIVKELTINNTFYLITIIKNTSILKFYISDNNGNLNEKTVDLSHLKFTNSTNKTVSLYSALIETGGDPFRPTIQIEHISNDSQPSLALSSKTFKVYTYEKGEIIFTLDNNPFSTDILKINLNDFTADLKSIKQPEIAQHEYYANAAKSNSFLIDDKILQIKTTPDVLFFTVSEQNGVRINQFKTLREEEISYKNSDVYQESGSIHNKKVLEKPKQFIRKINNSSPAVTCYKLNGSYYTTIGSSQDISHAGPGGMGMSGGFGAAPSVGFSSSYTIGNLISYKDKNVVYTNCIFDADFNHIDDQVKTSAFEKARLFLEENEDVKESTSLFGKDLYKDLIVFKFNSFLYLGNYNKQNKKYQIFSFTE